MLTCQSCGFNLGTVNISSEDECQHVSDRAQQVARFAVILCNYTVLEIEQNCLIDNILSYSAQPYSNVQKI